MATHTEVRTIGETMITLPAVCTWPESPGTLSDLAVRDNTAFDSLTGALE